MNFENLPRFKNDKFQIINMIPEWARAYEVDAAAIERQIGIAHAWASSNPKKAPKKYICRFLMTWMRKAKQYGNLVTARPVTNPDAGKPAEDEVLTGEDWARMKKQIFGGGVSA